MPRNQTLRSVRELKALRLPRVDFTRLKLARNGKAPIVLPPEFKIDEAPRAIPLEEISPERVREAVRGSERMSSIMGAPRVFWMKTQGAGTFGPWQPFDCTRPTLILQDVRLTNATTCAIEAAFGAIPSGGTYPEPAPLTATGRSLILPWGGRWFLRLNSAGGSASGGTSDQPFIAWEAPPGASATDLLAIKSSGHVTWIRGTAVTNDVAAHKLLNADPDRQALIVSIATPSIGIYVTIDGNPPTAIGDGIPTASNQPALRFTSDDVPLASIYWIANIATAGTVLWNVAYQ